MKEDIHIPKVTDVAVAVIEEQSPDGDMGWYVYLINMKKETLSNVLVSSKGYGEVENKKVETSVLRHFIGEVEAESYAKIERIDEQVFGLSNEYLVSFYIDKVIYDKKYIFVAESIVKENLVNVPIIEQKGVMIQ